MRYVLTTALNLMCVPTVPWQRWIVKFWRVQQTGTGVISTELFCSPSRCCMNSCGGEFQHLLWLTCLSCLVLLVFLTLFFSFLNFMLTVWMTYFTYCISCVVSYKVEELRSRYDAKLQHVFLTFFSGVFMQKCQNLAWERLQNGFDLRSKTSISC